MTISAIDPAAFSVDLHDIQWLTLGDSEPPTLSDGKVYNALVPTQNPAIQMNDFTRLGTIGPQLLDEIGIAALGHEADVLAVGLVGNREPHGRRNRPGFLLGNMAKRKAQIVDLVLRRGEQEIALVAR